MNPYAYLIEEIKDLKQLREVQKKFFRFKYESPEGLYDSIHYIIIDHIIRNGEYDEFLNTLYYARMNGVRVWM